MLPALSALRVAVGLCGLSLVLEAIPAGALDTHTALAQYGYQSWQTDTGLPQNTVHAIVQGRDGYLWVATEGGLVRFDGVEFRAYTRANTQGLPSDLIDDLMEDREDGLWISTSGGLARMRAGIVEAFGLEKGIPATQVWRTFEDARGAVWALTAAGLFRIEGERATHVALDVALSENSRMVASSDGSLWLGTADGLLHAGADGAFHAMGAAGEVVALVKGLSDRVWVGMRSGLEECWATDCQNYVVPGGGNGRDGRYRRDLGGNGYGVVHRAKGRASENARCTRRGRLYLLRPRGDDLGRDDAWADEGWAARRRRVAAGRRCAFECGGGS
jgi:streptogramin lyase